MRIALLGDMAFFGHVSMGGNPQYADYFHKISVLLKDFDYVVGNLETPFSFRKKKYGAKSVFLCAEPENIELLKMLHVNAVTIANNHMFDYGREGYELTKHLLDEARIEWFGAEGKDLKVEMKGNKLALTGWCCYSTNPQGCVNYGDYGLNELDVSVVKNKVREYSIDGWLNITAIHAGTEHVNYPSLDTIHLAEELVKTAPMVYYGHHPHVAQPLEKSNSSLIAYSLGNFCFDDTYNKSTDKEPFVRLTEANRSSFVLSVSIEKNQIIGYDVIPIYIGEKEIEVGRGVTKEQLNCYLEKLKTLPTKEYEAMRHEQRMEWLGPRKAKRNLAWIIKRLKPMYAKLMLTNKQNAKKYMEHVSSQL